MKANMLHHVSLPVSDLQRSIAFYSDILCLKKIERPAFDFEGAWYEIGEGQLHLIVDEACLTSQNELLIQEGNTLLCVLKIMRKQQNG